MVSLDRCFSHHYSLGGNRPCKIHKICKKTCSWFTERPNVDGKEHLQAVSLELLTKNGQHWYKILCQARRHPTKRGFFPKNKPTHLTFLVHSLICSFFFSQVVLQNIIIQSFQGELPIFTLSCFVRPHYASDLATSHCGQIFQNIPFFWKHTAVHPLYMYCCISWCHSQLVLGKDLGNLMF